MRQELSLALYCLVFVSLYAGVLRYPSVALTAVCCMFALDQWGQSVHPWLAGHQSVTNLAIGLIVLQAAVSRRIQRGGWDLTIPLEWSTVAALFAYALISLAWTPRLDLAWPLWVHQAPYILTMIFLTPLLMDDVTEIRRALRWLVIVGGGLVLGILLLGKWGYRGLTIDLSVAGYETNPLALATFSGIVVCAAVFLGERERRAAWRVTELGIAAAGILLVIRTESRGQLAGLVAALFLLAPVAFPLTRLKGLMTVAIIGAAAVVTIAIGLHDYTTLGYGRWTEESMADSMGGRFEMAKALLAAWQNSPLTLVFGLGNSASFDPRIVGFYPHIVPLEILGEEGLLGFLLYLAILYMALKNFTAGRYLARADEANARLIAALGSIVIFTFLASLKEGNLLGNTFFFLAVVILARAVQPLKARRRINSPAGETIPAAARPHNLME